MAAQVGQPAAENVGGLQARTDVERKPRQLAHRDAALDMIDGRDRGVTPAGGVLGDHLLKPAGGVELHSGHGWRGVSRQHRAVLAEQGKTRAAAPGKLLVEALERLRRYRYFRDPGE